MKIILSTENSTIELTERDARTLSSSLKLLLNHPINQMHGQDFVLTKVEEPILEVETQVKDEIKRRGLSGSACGVKA